MPPGSRGCGRGRGCKSTLYSQGKSIGRIRMLKIHCLKAMLTFGCLQQRGSDCRSELMEQRPSNRGVDIVLCRIEECCLAFLKSLVDAGKYSKELARMSNLSFGFTVLTELLHNKLPGQ